MGGRGSGLGSFVFCKSQHIIIVVGDREFGRSIEGLFESLEDVDFVFDLVEEGTDVFELEIEKQGSAIFPADGGKGFAEALEGLEHDGDAAVEHHGPDGFGLALFGNGHNQAKAQLFVEGNRCLDVVDKDVGG